MNSQDSRPGRFGLAACTMMVAASFGQGPAAASHGEASKATQATQRISRYCATSWRNARIANQDWTDCTQEVLVELLRRVSHAGLVPAIEDPESAERRELNRSIWCTIQRHRRAPRFACLSDDAVPACQQHELRSEGSREVRQLIQSADGLSKRQRRILALAADGWTVAEIAERLELPAARVSDEKYKAIRKLRQACGQQGAVA